jgi:hypothetical protein
MNKFTYDQRSQRYRYTTGPQKGQFVSTAAVTRLVEDYIIQQRRDTATITDILLSGKISPSTWEYGIATALKQMHINSYSLGRGGIGRLTADDIAIIENRLRSEFKFLSKFTKDIASGALSEAQIKNRLSLYVDGIHGAWQKGREESAASGGAKLELWNCVSDRESCNDCNGKAALGWQPIGKLGTPGVGVQCLSRCRCIKRFSDQVELLGRRDGWVA